MNSDDSLNNFEQNPQFLESYDDNSDNNCEWQRYGSGVTELLRQRLANSLNDELDKFRQSVDMLTKSCNCLYAKGETPQNQKVTEQTNRPDADNLADQLFTTEILNDMLTYASFVLLSKLS